MKFSLLAVLCLSESPAFPAAPASPAAPAVSTAPARAAGPAGAGEFGIVYVSFYGFKGNLLLNGLDSCPFAEKDGLPAKTSTNAVCNPFKGKLRKGENVLTATFEKVPISAGKAAPGLVAHRPQESPLLKIELADSGDSKLMEWDISSEASPKEIRFQFPPAPRSGAAASKKPGASSRPVAIREKEIPDERVEAACGNEIGLLCEAVRKKPKALLACLEENRDNLLPLCRTVISLRD